MNISGETPPFLLIVIFQMCSLLRNHHQKWPNPIAAHPKNIGAVASYETVPNEPLGVCLGLVRYVFGVEWESNAEISNFKRL